MSGAQPAPGQHQPTKLYGIVKQVLSGDIVVIKHKQGYPPKEKTIYFSSITAPKLGRRPTPNQTTESEDEPWAWEAREFLRKKLVGKDVSFITEKNVNQSSAPSGQSREYGTVFLENGNGSQENMTEALIREGLASMRNDSTRTPELQKLQDLQEQAKAAKRGKWSDDNTRNHVRSVKWTVDNVMNFVDKLEQKPVKAVIENVRDGSTVRAFILSSDSMEMTYITLMMCGIRCPGQKLDSEGKPDPTVKVDFAEEARYFTESRLLHHDVDVILLSSNNNNFVGTIYHPKGSIAEELLKAGYAKCVDWSMSKMNRNEIEKLKKAEKIAQEKRLRLWKDYTPPPKIDGKSFEGTVVEVINGDALVVKTSNGEQRKIFLASIRPPRDQTPAPAAGDDKTVEPRRMKRPLYDVPWMFEAREYLRKKLIGKKVNVTVDYVQPARDTLPEKQCCTVLVANQNVAEAMLSKGLASLIFHKQTDDQRASNYDSLIAAESKAQKSNKGVHNKKDVPVHRVNDICGDPVKAKNLLPHIKRSERIEAVVEFVANGSRLRLFLPKDSHLIVFLLSGVEVRHNAGDAVNNETAALNFTKEKCLQRDVEIQVESIDKNGNFCGWLWVDKINLSVALVEAGLAKIHFTGLNSLYSKDLQNAKNAAKAKGVWKYVDKEETTEVIEVEDKTVERKLDYKEVLVVETTELSFWCQYADQGGKLNALQAKLSQEMGANPPLAGSYQPKRGDTCAAKYPVDDMWYRAKVEKVSGGKVTVLYIDYGNRAEISSVQCASLPPSFGEKPFANQYSLAFVGLPPDPEDQKTAAQHFQEEVQDKVLLLNYEYTDKGINHVTLYDSTTKDDIGKWLVGEGLVLVQPRREKRMEDVVKAYQEAENSAKSKRQGMWLYGDIREDDDKEFGMGR